MRRSHRLPALALSLAACASVDLEQLPYCPSLEVLQPLPDAESCADAALMEAVLSNLIEKTAGALLVRVEFDPLARPRAVCAERSADARWRHRRRLAARVDEILAIPPGPSCLAERRLDLNRYRSKLAEIRRVERECRQEAQSAREARPETPRHAVGSLLHRQFERCMEARADWLLLDPVGRGPELIFAKPEVPVPPAVRARDTASRCTRTAYDFAAKVACIQREGWELLVERPGETALAGGENVR